MASYATIAQLKAWLSAGTDSEVVFTSDDNAALQLLLDAATTFIEQYTGRVFEAQDAATKEFYATSPGELSLPDIRTITALTYDSSGNNTFSTTLVAGTDFYLTPLNPQPDPTIYTGVKIFPNSSKGFSGGYRVRVMGNWGYVIGSPLAAPPNIQTACLLQAARYWARKGAPLGMLQNTDLGTFARLSKEDPEVVALLAPYKVATRSPMWLVV